MSKEDNLNRVLKAVGGALAVAAGAVQVIASLKGGSSEQLDISDDVDWVCDNCGADLNSQLGFRAGHTWVCKSCGYLNDVSSDNIVPTKWAVDERGDEFEVPEMPTPWYDADPEDY